MQSEKPGARVDKAPYLSELGFDARRMRVTTERYASRDYQARERAFLWMRVWQLAGRADELPEPGDWKVHSIYNQSFILVRGKDGEIRGFVNACRHRGNALCKGKGRASRFICSYHKWSYGLDGQLLAVPKPDFDGPLEDFVGAKDELALRQVPVECFAGFIFLNPDPQAPPLADFLGEAADLLAPYRLEEMVPVGLNVRESLSCNWKVVVDAFQEGYHIHGVHPELISSVDLGKERCSFFGDHGAATVPFGGRGPAGLDAEQEVETVRSLPPANFPGLAEVLPRFEALVAAHRGADGGLNLPAGVSARTLLQQATRDTLSAKGLDVGGLTDNQMSDYQFWLLFPNVFIQVRAGEATVISAEPHPYGDPERCVWRVAVYLWLPPEQRAAQRAELVDIPEGEHFSYFLALEQDWEQMQAQQEGLRNSGLEYMTLTRQEVRVAHFHAALDSWLDETTKRSPPLPQANTAGTP
jgi:phenylpropionate dioxygenase-like ring-hydroxylating dioxygenase large terminal subunit